MITVWVQSSDFSTDDLGALDVEAAIERFRSHDWVSEAALEEQLQGAGKESCPAGIGFNHDEGGFLHVCPMGEGRNLVSFQYSVPTKILGLFASNKQVSKTADGDGLPDETCEKLIRLFYGGDSEAIARAMP